MPLALAMFVRHGRIEPSSGPGKAYLVCMLIGAVTVYPLAHSGAGLVLATVTLALLLVGFTVHRSRGRAARYVETIALTLTVFLLLIPTVTEILRRVPEGHPIAASLDAPILKSAHLALLIGLIVGLALQIRALRRR